MLFAPRRRLQVANAVARVFVPPARPRMRDIPDMMSCIVARQITIRGVSDEARRKLRAMADARGVSVNALLVEILEQYTGASDRRERLRRYATWTEQEARAFDASLRAQRVVDPRDWE